MNTNNPVYIKTNNIYPFNLTEVEWKEYKDWSKEKFLMFRIIARTSHVNEKCLTQIILDDEGMDNIQNFLNEKHSKRSLEGLEK